MKKTSVLFLLSIMFLSLSICSCGSDDNLSDGDTDGDTSTDGDDDVAADGDDDATVDGDDETSVDGDDEGSAADGDDDATVDGDDETSVDGDDEGSAADGDDESTGTEHTYWTDVTWEQLFPAADKTATYKVQTFNSETKEVSAKVEYGVDLEGETWNRVVMGTPEAGNDAMTVYFDHSTPWVLKVKGTINYDVNITDGPSTKELFATPVEFPLDIPTGEEKTVNGTMDMYISLGSGDPMTDTMAMTYKYSIETFDGSLTTEYGSLTGCLKMNINVNMQSTTTTTKAEDDGFDLELWIHPEHSIVYMDDAPGFISLDFKGAWE